MQNSLSAVYGVVAIMRVRGSVGLAVESLMSKIRKRPMRLSVIDGDQIKINADHATLDIAKYGLNICESL